MLLSFKRYLIFRMWKSFNISEKLWEIIFLLLFFSSDIKTPNELFDSYLKALKSE